MCIDEALKEIIKVNGESIKNFVKSIKELEGLVIHLIYDFDEIIVTDNNGNTYMREHELELDLDLRYEDQKKLVLDALSSVFTHVYDEEYYNENKEFIDSYVKNLREGFINIYHIDHRSLMLLDKIKNLNGLPKIPCKRIKIYYVPELRKPINY